MEVNMVFRNPFKNLSKFEWFLWSTSIFTIVISFTISGGFLPLTLSASIIGVTALIFLAKGDVWGQLLTVLFSLLYALISLKYRYFGEMITYLGMTAPIAILSVISWLKNPYSGTAEVRVHQLGSKEIFRMLALTSIVTIAFYYILELFSTANLIVSTVSIATSFLASYLTLHRSPAYALAFAANDIVLIILWVLATIEDVSYFPMIANFVMFLLNDIYGFFNWLKMKQRQKSDTQNADELLNSNIG
jgi:nicotinamide mononucleotide transporter PnuC